MRERARARRRDVAGWWRVGAAVAGGVALQMERERPGAAPVARSYGLHAEELEPGADPHGSGCHRPRIRTRRPESSSPPCAPPRAAAAVSWSCPPAARPSPPRLRTRAGRPAAAAPLRRADMGGERGLRAVATSGGLATSVRVVVGGGGGRGGRRSGARPPGAAPEAGIEREKGRGRGARGEGSGDGWDGESGWIESRLTKPSKYRV